MLKCMKNHDDTISFETNSLGIQNWEHGKVEVSVKAFLLLLLS